MQHTDQALKFANLEEPKGKAFAFVGFISTQLRLFFFFT